MLKGFDNIYDLSHAVFFGAIILLVFYLYYFFARNEFIEDGKKNNFKFLINKLIIATLFFLAAHTTIKAINQYYAWSGNELSQLLLPPHQSIGYFVFYVFNRFWLGILISVAISFLFYLFLKFLEKRRGRFFIDGEVNAGFLLAVVSGWPGFVFFLPLVFIFTILVATFRRLIFKEQYTTLGYSFILAALAVFLFGNKIVEALNISFLKI